MREANGIMIYFLHSASKIHGSEEHSIEASIRTKRNLKMQDFEFTSHQIISTTVLMRFWHKPETSIHSQKEEEKKTTLNILKYFSTGYVLRDRSLEPASGFYKSI